MAIEQTATSDNLEIIVKTLQQRVETLEIAFRMEQHAKEEMKVQQEQFENFLHDRNFRLYQLWKDTHGRS